MKKKKTKLSLITFLISLFLIISFNNFNFFSKYKTKEILNLNVETVDTNISNSTDQNKSDKPQSENSRILSNDTSSYVSVGELYSGSGKFNKTNLQSLFNYMNGKDNTNFSIIETLSKGKTSLGIEGYSSANIRNKNNNKDIVVTLGDLTWQVMYLATDTNGDTILTLWLTGGQSAWKNRTNIEGDWYGFATPPGTDSNKKVLYSTFTNDGVHNNYWTTPTPTALYGLSYINAITLNNGGRYISSMPNDPSNPNCSGVVSTFTNLNANNVFARFTMQNVSNSLTNFLVQPKNVPWQRTLFSNSIINESSAKVETTKNDTISAVENHADYFGWTDKYIWLPTHTETGYSASSNGLWQSSINQMSTFDNTKIVGSLEKSPWGTNMLWWKTQIGKKSNTNQYIFLGTYYPRGAVIGIGGYSLVVNGSVDGLNGLQTYSTFAVRPALHLNLSKAIDSAYDIWNNKTTKFEKNNLDILLQKVGGDNTITSTNIEKLNIQAEVGKNAKDMGDIIIRFGGFSWYAVYLFQNNLPEKQIILTLFFVDSSQLYRKNKDGSVKYNVYGSLSWNSGASPYKDTEENLGTGQFSNNYGNSNIRTSLFSTASTTTNFTSVFYPYLKTSTNKTAMGDFIISPNALNTQDTLNLQKSQTAKSTLGFRYNLPNESYANLDKLSPKYSINNVMLSNSEAFLSMPIMLPSTGTADTQTTLIINEKLASTNSALLNYTAWQNDKLWLPSLSEVGLGTNNTISTNSIASNNLRTAGLWGLSTAQRSNTNKTATWLRSGHISDKNLAYTISSDGLDYGYASINTQNAIRPALHLNLTLACQYSS